MDPREITKQAASIRADRIKYSDKSLDSLRNASKFAQLYPTLFEKCCDLSFPEDDIELLLNHYHLLTKASKEMNLKDSLEHTTRLVMDTCRQKYQQPKQTSDILNEQGKQRASYCIVS